MKRLVLLFTVAALMALMMAITAVPATAQVLNIDVDPDAFALEEFTADASAEQASGLAQLGSQSANPTFAQSRGFSTVQFPVFSRDTFSLNLLG